MQIKPSSNNRNVDKKGESNQNSKISKELKINRVLILNVSLGIALSGFAFKMVNPNYYDPWPLRLTVAGIFALVFILTFVSKFVERNISDVFYWTYFALVFWVIFLLVANRFDGSYVVAAMMTVFGPSFLPFKRIWQYLLTTLVVVGLIAVSVFYVKEAIISPVMVLVFSAMGGLASYLNQRSRLKIQRKLVASEDLMRTIFNETVDALFLADIRTLQIIDCNKQALVMFGFQDKTEVLGSKGTEKLFKADLPSPQLVKAAIDAVKKTGIYKAKRQYTTTRGLSFWADLVLRKFSLGDKQMLLVRISNIDSLVQAQQESEKKAQELERMNRLMVGRELKMSQMKKELQSLKTSQSQ